MFFQKVLRLIFTEGKHSSQWETKRDKFDLAMRTKKKIEQKVVSGKKTLSLLHCFCKVYGNRIIKRVNPYKHTACIPRWNDVETIVSTSFQRGIHLVCLQGRMIMWCFRTKLSPLFDFIFIRIYKDSFSKQISSIKSLNEKISIPLKILRDCSL